MRCRGDDATGLAVGRGELIAVDSERGRATQTKSVAVESARVGAGKISLRARSPRAHGLS